MPVTAAAARPRILHVETGRHLYGGARQVLYLLEALEGRGFDNLLVCTRGSALAREAAGRVQTLPLPWHGELDLLAAGRLLAVLRRERPALVHAHSRRGADWHTAVAAALAGVPAVVTRRVDNPESGLAVRWRYRRYARVIAISGAIAAGLERDIGPSLPALARIPSAVDTGRFRPGGDRAWLAAEFDLSPDQPVLAMVAQFIPRKGHALLLEALPQVWARHPGVVCLLLGQGPGRQALAREIEVRGWSARLRLPGFRHDLPRILPAVDALVHPAFTEGLGVALLEAAACALPVVAAAVGGATDVVLDGETGLLVPPGDARALAGALCRLLDAPELGRRLGVAGLDRVVRQFSVAAMADAHATLYRELLEENPSP